uniref:CCHC-type domain-containing protein n=1 Tax=Oreochromis niloticus TaxID=8128 RepID=A0A669B355_ORENI
CDIHYRRICGRNGYCHPPAVFSIGADRGFLVYAGQPQACRKCGSVGHNAEQCDQVRCRSCGKLGHITRDCKEPRRCHLCDSEEHMARDCFLVYAGQPQACRKCGSVGHNAEQCDQVRCRSCGKLGHITRDCKEPRRCHLCDSEEHMARDCTKGGEASWSIGGVHGSGVGVLCGDKDIRIIESFTVIQGRVMVVDIDKTGLNAG